MPITTLQPDIQLGDLRVAEPVITLTGLFICAFSVYAWTRARSWKSSERVLRYIEWFFGFLALSSFFGAVFGHAFQYAVGFGGKAACWVFNLLSLGALGQAALYHSASHFEKFPFRTISLTNLLMLAAALGLISVFQSYYAVEIFAAFTLLGLVLPLEWMIFKRRRDPAALLLLWSVPLSALSVLPHLFKWSPHVWVSYFDIGHVVVLSSLWVILRAGERMGAHAQEVLTGN